MYSFPFFNPSTFPDISKFPVLLLSVLLQATKMVTKSIVTIFFILRVLISIYMKCKENKKSSN